MTSYLPPHEGWLPQWLLLVAVTSIGNSIQAYSTLSYTQRVYAGGSPDPKPPTKTPVSPVTALSARTFGTWTFLTAIVRLYAAYHINEPAWYQIAAVTYAVAFAHFMSELLVFGTAKVRSPWLAPAAVSTTSLLWMGLQYGYYVK